MDQKAFNELTRDYEHIIFDFGGIFVNIRYEEMLKNLSLICDREIDQDLFNQSKQNPIFSDYEMGKLSDIDFTKALASILNIKHDHAQLVEAWNSILFGIPIQRIEFLKNLKEVQNKKIYLLSNINQIHEDFMISYFKDLKIDFYQYFNKVYFSHHIHMRKPNQDIFQYVLGDIGIQPEEAFFIDDSIQHIETAKKIGIQAFHLDKQNSLIVSF